jgi:hypothetical protein
MSGLREAFDEIVADVPVYGDLGRAIEQADRERRRRHGVAAVLVAAAAAVAVIVGVLAGTRDGSDSQQPIGPVTTPAPTSTERTSAAVAWKPPEPLRPAASRVVQVDHDTDGNALPVGDSGDTAIAEIDIVRVGEGSQFQGGSSWILPLASRPPLDPADRIVAYGVVVDGDGDQRADCEIGINNDAPTSGDLHVWVTNLRTHETAVQDGPPYGVPVEFSHPAEEGNGGFAPEMHFGFLRGLKHPAPCDPFGDPSTFYAWSSVTEGGQVVAQDYAPDAAWMPISWR